ncbi:MAC/perforin domain-containing protein [Candidatus Magnetaquicoccus inordinatus]|uniref:MAC/perforin domain-containing protein n=1 Tax=Candidatus Magnetaquicoccus inordinatus TaxID=2496818 RepID=UPI00102BFD6F|nr:MAC/perforin domain-containing protein [Candidatus Magnetaquicoccus inordinatus]
MAEDSTPFILPAKQMLDNQHSLAQLHDGDILPTGHPQTAANAQNNLAAVLQQTDDTGALPASNPALSDSAALHSAETKATSTESTEDWALQIKIVSEAQKGESDKANETHRLKAKPGMLLADLRKTLSARGIMDSADRFLDSGNQRIFPEDESDLTVKQLLPDGKEHAPKEGAALTIIRAVGKNRITVSEDELPAIPKGLEVKRPKAEEDWVSNQSIRGKGVKASAKMDSYGVLDDAGKRSLLKSCNVFHGVLMKNSQIEWSFRQPIKPGGQPENLVSVLDAQKSYINSETFTYDYAIFAKDLSIACSLSGGYNGLAWGARGKISAAYATSESDSMKNYYGRSETIVPKMELSLLSKARAQLDGEFLEDLHYFSSKEELETINAKKMAELAEELQRLTNEINKRKADQQLRNKQAAEELTVLREQIQRLRDEVKKEAAEKISILHDKINESLKKIQSLEKSQLTSDAECANDLLQLNKQISSCQKQQQALQLPVTGCIPQSYDAFFRMRAFFEKWGAYLPVEFLIGGKLFLEDRTTITSHEKREEMQLEFQLKLKSVSWDMALSGSVKKGSEESSGSQSKSAQLNAVGGDPGCVNSVAEWTASLAPATSWRCCKVNRIIPIYQLASETQQENIYRIMMQWRELWKDNPLMIDFHEFILPLQHLGRIEITNS